MNKYKNKEKRGHANLFYLFIFALSILAAFSSSLNVFDDGTGADVAYETYCLSLSTALLVVSLLYAIKRWSVLQEESDEVLRNITETKNITLDVRDKFDEVKSFKDLVSDFILNNGGVDSAYAYISREAYYIKYYHLVSSSSDSVKIIADGFGCHTPENEDLALGLYRAMETALKNGSKISRFQYTNTISLKWLKMLLQLKSRYGDRFKLFINSDFDPTIIPYVICIVDKSLCTASVNVMFTMNADTSMEEKLGGPGFISENNAACAATMDQVISGFFNSKYSVTIKDMEKLYNDIENQRKSSAANFIFDNKCSRDETAIYNLSRNLNIPDIELLDSVLARSYKIDREYYFAFGSNMLGSRIRHENRAPSAIMVDRGVLRNHKVVFDIRGNLDEGSDGGVANITPALGEDVHGVLYLVDKPDLDRLQAREEHMGYKTAVMEIDKGVLGKIKAKVFMADGDDKHYQPTVQYAKLISDGMKEACFPIKYQEKIERIMCSRDGN